MLEMMKNKTRIFGYIVGIFLGSIVLAYASTLLFYSASYTIELSKKTYFQFDLSGNSESVEIGPGDEFSVSPAVYNDATENMFTFIKVEMPTVDDEPVYEYDIADEWELIETGEDNKYFVYAYMEDDENCKILMPGETTEPIFTSIKMKEINNCEYYIISDINVVITGYAVGVEDVSQNVEQAWASCKQLIG